MMWDAIVVGAGIEGSAAAYTLAKQGRKTLQLEQFILPHSRGSSHGSSRIIRTAYPVDYYMHIMTDAFKLWKQLETDAKQQLYVKTGVLFIDSTGSPALDAAAKSTENCEEACERLTGQQLRDRFRAIQFDDSYSAVFDPTGGILCADKCLRAYQTQFVKYGGVLQDGEPVLGVTSSGQIANVKTTKGDYAARSVVIAAGPWTSRLTEPLGLHLPLQPERVSVWYWKQLESSAFGGPGSPVFVKLHKGREVYGFPIFEYPGYVKLVFHGGPKTDADRRDADGENPFYRNSVVDFVKQHLKGIETTPSISETCIYTMTPDNHCILDTHPQHKNIIVAAGFSGQGFKLAPVVGKVVADFVAGKTPSSYDLSHFRISRFTDGEPTNVSKL